MLFLRAHSLSWGLAYAACAVILYSFPVFNSSPLFPLLFAIVFLPFTAYPGPFFLRAAFAGIVSAAFVTVIAAKSLTLTHRDFWVQCAAYCLAYLSLLSFFASAITGSFLLSWLFTLVLILCTLTVAFRDVRVAFPAVCVMRRRRFRR